MAFVYQPDRYLLKQQIQRQSSFIGGRVLDVGAGEFSRYEGLFQCDEYIKMDKTSGENIDAIGNVENLPFPGESFNSIVCTQVLGDIQNPQQAVKEFFRVLKPGGTVLLTESQTNETHDEPHDYWRFTKFSLEYLFKQAGFTVVAMDQRGGYFTTRAQTMIRYLIDKYNLASRNISRRVMNKFFKAWTMFMIHLDKIDKSLANRKHAIGWLIVAKKPSE